MTASRRPAVLAAIALMAGVCLRNCVPAWPRTWLLLIALLAVSYMLLRRRPRIGFGLCLSALCASGILLGQLSAFFYPRDHIGTFTAAQPRLAQLELAIDQPPRVRWDPYSRGRPLPPRQAVTARVLRAKTPGGWKPCRGGIQVHLGQFHPRLSAGQTVRVTGMLERPGPAMNPGEFDWQHYCRDRRILASISIPHADDVEILTDDGPSLLCRAREKIRHLLAAGFTSEQALDHALLRAMLLGDHDSELVDVQDQFRRTGAGFHLSVSGMHVAVLAGMVYLLCRALCLRPHNTVIVATIFIVLYGLMALPTIPVLRSMTLGVALAIVVLNRRTADRVQLLALCAMGIVIVEPSDLFSAGFQLGFATILGIALLTRPAHEFLLSLRDPDVIIASQWDKILKPRRRRFWRDLLDWLRRRLVFALVAGLIAWVVSAPLVAFHFEAVNIWSIPSAFILAWIVLVALVGGALKILLTALWPGLGATWALAAALPVAAIRHIVAGMARLPGAGLPLPSPPVWLIVAFYLLLCLPMMVGTRLTNKPRLRWVVRSAPLIACLLLPLSAAFGSFRMTQGEDLAIRPGETRLTLLSVGAGQCAVVETPDGGATFIDDGSDTVSEVFRSCLAPFIRHEGRHRVDSIFLSHGDYDHISATNEAVATYDVPVVYASPHLRRHSYESAPCEQMLADLDAIGRSPKTIVKGDSIKLADDVDIQVLWPPANSKFDSNNCGLVLRLCCAGKSILFPADIQEPAERELLKNPEMLKSDVLVAPHHGSSESTTAAFVAAVNPSIILCSNAGKMTGKQLTFDKLVAGRPLYRTHICGAIMLTIGRDGAIRVETFIKPEKTPTR